MSVENPLSLRINIPGKVRQPQAGFMEIAEEADEANVFDDNLSTILRLMQKAARERDYTRTHLLTVSLHAFLYYKGGSYPLPTQSTQPPPMRCPSPPRLSRPRTAHGTETHFRGHCPLPGSPTA